MNHTIYNTSARKALFALFLLIIVIVGAGALNPVACQAGGTTIERPVLIELFTSQGCSSCPAADNLLEKLNPRPGIITVSEHVDYWNYLGWQDPFSRKTFTDRQYAYARRLGKKGVYTPQVIVDGRFDCLGSSREQISRAIETARRTPVKKLTITPRLTSGSLIITVKVPVLKTEDRKSKARLILFITEDHLTKKISRGENQGRTLSHTSVARIKEERPFNSNSGPTSITFKVDPEKSWNMANVNAVAFIQKSTDSSVIALGKSSIVKKP